MLPRHSVQTYQGKELTCNSSGNARLQSSQLAEPLWSDSGLNSGIGECELVSTFIRKKMGGGGGSVGGE